MNQDRVARPKKDTSAQVHVCDHVLASLREDFLVFAEEGDYTTEDLVGGIAMALGLVCVANEVASVKTDHILVTLLEDK